MSAQSGRNSGGDLFDMAEKGTTVPDDAAKPRTIPSKPRPDQIASADDPNQMGSTSIAGAATNAGDIPRSAADKQDAEVISGTGDALPAQVDSKRLHNVPGGVEQDPFAKGSTRMAKHKVQDSEFEEAAMVDRAPGDENLTDEQAMDKLERKE